MSSDLPPRLYLAMEDVLRGDPVEIAERQEPYVRHSRCAASPLNSTAMVG
jgi:hypothetical protein